MSDPRRELYLEQEIARIQEEKLGLLKDVREARGKDKADLLDRFLSLNKAQEKLESDLETLQED